MPLAYEEEVVRSQVWGRTFLFAPTGAGKSRAALELASRMFGGELRITYINTERDREKLYADRYRYELINLAGLGSGPSNAELPPELFIEALDLAEARNPGGVYIIDSASHEWMAVLAMSDRFSGWSTLTPRHDAFTMRIQNCDAHIIVCCRAKLKYEQTEEETSSGGKRQVVRLLGLGPEQRATFQYDFNLVGQGDASTKEFTWSGHVDPLLGQSSNMLQDAQHVADVYTRWLSEGIAVEPVQTASEEDIEALRASLLAEGVTEERINEGFGVARAGNRGKLHPDYVAKNLANSQKRLAKKAAAGAVDPAEPVTPKPDEVAAIPDGDPTNVWTVAQLDAYAVREAVAPYPADGNKEAKVAAIGAFHVALDKAAAEAAAAEEEDIPFGDGSAEDVPAAAEPVQETIA